MISMLKNLTIKNKIIAIVLLTSSIVFLLAAVALSLRERVSFFKEGQEKLALIADEMGKDAHPALLTNNCQAAVDILSPLSSYPHICAAYILSGNGAPLAEYHRNGAQCTLSPGLPTVLQGSRQKNSDYLWNWDSDLIVVKPITTAGQAIGTIIIHSDTRELAGRLRWFLVIYGLIALAGLLVAYFVTLRVQGIISKPILELARTMKLISAQRNYSLRAEKSIDDEIGDLINGFNEMLDQIEERDERLAYLAHFDSLTELPNRLMFKDRLSQALHLSSRTSKQMAILFVDLDEFKDVNDTLGHRFGDLLLKEVAVRLRAQVRQCDTLARLGGDEFIIFMQDINNVANVIKIAEKINETFSGHFILEGKEVYITTSVGISLYPADGTTGEELIKNADTAMYHAKRLGKNCFQFFSAQMHKLASRRLSMINSLRRAIEKQELIIHYQPKVEIASGMIIGMEALVRWEHPELGLIHPQQFIPLAEETGIIIPIGEWVINTVCWQIKEWLELGLNPPSVAINVSACQFRNHNIEALIARALEETGIDPKYLELELTESAIMLNMEEAIETFGILKSMGIHISIDDFGTGYSSLVHLKRFPIDRIKIDGSFVKNIPENRDDCAIVIAIIAMAVNLNLKVIAEGVETEEQLAFLEEQGCHEMQGFLCGCPVPRDQLVAFLYERNWRKVKANANLPSFTASPEKSPTFLDI